MIHVKPNARSIALIGQFLTAVSHHDPNVKSISNTALFRRQKQRVRYSVTLPDPEHIDNLVSCFPVPQALAQVFQNLDAIEFLATATCHALLHHYNGKGLLTGSTRYAIFEDRVRNHAIAAPNLFQFWGALTAELQVGSVSDPNLAMLLGAHTSLARGIMLHLSRHVTTCVMLARLWTDHKESTISLQLKHPEFVESNEIYVEVPAISSNSLRHEMVREPGMLHLLERLSLTLEELPASVQALLFNGGDLNQTAPPNAFALARQIRVAYPLLGLLGGCTDGFILGSSNLEVSAWLVCRENNAALEQFGLRSQLSVFDMMDTVQHARHSAGRVEASPMPFSFETLSQGAEVLINFRVRPYVRTEEIGALWCALRAFEEADSTLFGQAARGYGMMKLTPHNCEPDSAAMTLYEQHLTEQAELLAGGLRSGMLTTARKVLS